MMHSNTGKKETNSEKVATEVLTTLVSLQIQINALRTDGKDPAKFEEIYNKKIEEYGSAHPFYLDMARYSNCSDAEYAMMVIQKPVVSDRARHENPIDFRINAAYDPAKLQDVIEFVKKLSLENYPDDPVADHNEVVMQLERRLSVTRNYWDVILEANNGKNVEKFNKEGMGYVLDDLIDKFKHFSEEDKGILWKKMKNNLDNAGYTPAEKVELLRVIKEHKIFEPNKPEKSAKPNLFKSKSQSSPIKVEIEKMLAQGQSRRSVRPGGRGEDK